MGSATDSPAPVALEATPHPALGVPPSPWDHPEYLRLPDKMRLFVRAYLMRVDRNATQAYRDAKLPGKKPNVLGSQYKSRAAAALAVLEPMVRERQRWQIQNAHEGTIPVCDVLPETLTKDDLNRILSGIVQGRDPRGSEVRGFGVLMVRAQDMVAAGKLLAQINGWVDGPEQKHLHLHTNPDASKSREELTEEVERLRAKRLAVEAKFADLGVVHIPPEVIAAQPPAKPIFEKA